MGACVSVRVYVLDLVRVCVSVLVWRRVWVRVLARVWAYVCVYLCGACKRVCPCVFGGGACVVYVFV